MGDAKPAAFASQRSAVILGVTAPAALALTAARWVSIAARLAMPTGRGTTFSLVATRAVAAGTLQERLAAA
jgi:hypothetical protein